MAEFLLELLAEEIPARMQARASDDLRRLVTEKLSEAGLGFGKADAYATPRRLTLHTRGDFFTEQFEQELGHLGGDRKQNSSPPRGGRGGSGGERAEIYRKALEAARLPRSAGKGGARTPIPALPPSRGKDRQTHHATPCCFTHASAQALHRSRMRPM